MKAKEWLVKEGHLAATGKGRLSFENHKRLKNAIKDGVTFEDYTLDGFVKLDSSGRASDSSTPRPAVASKPRKPRSVAPTSAPVRQTSNLIPDLGLIQPAPLLFPMDSFKAVEVKEDGKKVTRSMREVCYTCGVSLVQCGCGNPYIISQNPLRGPSHVPVEIRPL